MAIHAERGGLGAMDGISREWPLTGTGVIVQL